MIAPAAISSSSLNGVPGSTVLATDRWATDAISASSNSPRSAEFSVALSALSASLAIRSPMRSKIPETGASVSGAGTRSTRSARLSSEPLRFSSTRRNQHSESSATIAPVSSNSAMSADAERVPIRVTRNRARRTSRANGAVMRTRPKRQGRKLTSCDPELSSASSARKACSAPSSSAGCSR
jgi:hypothetical protein